MTSVAASRLALPICLAALGATWASSARADDAAAATALFNAGRDAMKQGDYATACPELAESVRLQPSVGALAKLGACEEHEKRLVSARARWEQALNLARSVGDDRVRDVEGELTRLEAIVPKLSVTAAAPMPNGTVIRIDELELGAASVGVAFAVEPGKHVVVVSAPNKKSWSVPIDVIANGATTVLQIPALEDAIDPALPPSAPVATPLDLAPAPATESTAVRPWRVAAIVTAGAGVATLGVGAVLGLDAIAEKSAAHCAGTVCPSSAAGAKLDDAKSVANVSTIALAAGGVLVASGVAMWFLAPPASPHAARIEVRPALGGILVSGRF